MITRSELEQLLASTETYRVERIKFTTDKFGEAVCAFANDMPFCCWCCAGARSATDLCSLPGRAWRRCTTTSAACRTRS